MLVVGGWEAGSELRACFTVGVRVWQGSLCAEMRERGTGQLGVETARRFQAGRRQARGRGWHWVAVGGMEQRREWWEWWWWWCGSGVVVAVVW